MKITKKYAREYAVASKKARGRMLDELVATTGWSRANARRQVTAAGKRRAPQRGNGAPRSGETARPAAGGEAGAASAHLRL